MLRTTLSEAKRKVIAGEQLSGDYRLRVRRGIDFAAKQSLNSINLLFEGVGANEARADAPN